MGIHDKPGDSQNWVPVIPVILMVTLPMYFRGLFFPQEYMVAFLLSALVLLGYVRSTRVDLRRLLSTKMDVAAAILLLAYLVAIPAAARPRAAIEELFKVGLYLVVFHLGSRIPNRTEQRRLILWGLLAGVTIASLIGLFGVSGPWRYPGSLVGHRLASTFQYHNSFGIVLTVGLVLALGLQTQAERLWQRLILPAVSSLLFLSLIYTYSRGTWVTAAVALAALVVFESRDTRSVLMARILSVAIGAATAMPIFGRGVQELNYVVWVGWFLAAAIAILLTHLVELPVVRKRYALLTAVLVAATGVGLVTQYSRLPKDLLTRFASFNLNQQSVWERFAMDWDTLKMVAHNPVFGFGGGGWAAVHLRYQSYAYVTQLGHNNYLQTWAEAGILGFAALVALWYFFFRSLDWRRTSLRGDRRLHATIAVAAGAIGVHSVIDFDLSLAAIGVVLWTFFGLANGIALSNTAALRRAVRLNSRAAAGASARNQALVLLALILVVTPIVGSFEVGDYLTRRALREYRLNDVPKATKDMLLATRLDPINAEALTYAAQMEEQAQEFGAAFKLNSRAVRFDRFNPNILTTQSRLAFRLGNGDGAISAARQAVEMEPQNTLRYEILADLYSTLARYFLKREDVAHSDDFFQRVLAVADLMKQRNKEHPKGMPQTLPATSAAMEMYVGQAYLGLRQYDKAAEHERAAIDIVSKYVDKKLAAESYMWLGLALQRARTQSDSEAQICLRKAFDLDLQVGSKYVEAVRLFK